MPGVIVLHSSPPAIGRLGSFSNRLILRAEFIGRSIGPAAFHVADIKHTNYVVFHIHAEEDYQRRNKQDAPTIVARFALLMWIERK